MRNRVQRAKSNPPRATSKLDYTKSRCSPLLNAFQRLHKRIRINAPKYQIGLELTSRRKINGSSAGVSVNQQFRYRTVYTRSTAKRRSVYIRYLQIRDQYAPFIPCSNNTKRQNLRGLTQTLEARRLLLRNELEPQQSRSLRGCRRRLLSWISIRISPLTQLRSLLRLTLRK